MATEATDAPQVFARKATGLRREASARDVFIYNTNNQNVGIGVAFMVLLVPPLYAGASMVVATILAGPAGAADGVRVRLLRRRPCPARAATTSTSAARCTRTSGSSRRGTGWCGSSPTPASRPPTWPSTGSRGCAARPASCSTARGWSPTATTSPASGGSSWPARSCSRCSRSSSALGTRLYFRIQNVTFVIAMTGVVVGLVILAVKGHSDSRPHGFNTYVSGLGGSHNAIGRGGQVVAEPDSSPAST